MSTDIITTGALSGIDWRQIAGGLAIAAALAGLIAWQVRGVPEKCRNWLGTSALSLDALAMAMAVFWAIRQGGGLLTLFFAFGFIGLALSKAVTVSALVTAYREKKYGAFFVTLAALIGAYGAIYGAATFEGTLHSADKHHTAAIQSAPVQAVESELAAARARLSSLAGYADGTRAADETAAANDAAANIEAERRRLSSELGAARGELSACKPNYITNCIKPMTAKVERLRAELAALPVANGSDYANKHAEYIGLQQHVATLEGKRADLLSNGGAANTAAGADDRLVQWLFGIESTEKAAGLKWLLFVAVFDLLSLLLRLAGELLLGRDIAGEYGRRLRALIDAGLSPDAAAAAILGGNSQTIPPAQVRLNEPVPQMAVGGAILTDGLIHAHAGEVVVPAHEVKGYQDWKAQATLNDRLNALQNGAKTAQEPQQQANGYKAMPTQGNDLNKPMTTQANDLLANDYKPMTTKGNGLQVIACESCGVEVKQRTVWQRFCPTCSAERKKGVLRAKAKTTGKKS